jgi:hypothetical protein
LNVAEFIPCPWNCGYEYNAATIEEHEPLHLRECPVFQSLPVAEMRDGKQYVAVPDRPDILVERQRYN